MEELYMAAMESASESQKELLQEINEFGLYPRRLKTSATEAATGERIAEAKLAKALSYQLPAMGAACAAYLDALKVSKRKVIKVADIPENATDDDNEDILFRDAMDPVVAAKKCRTICASPSDVSLPDIGDGLSFKADGGKAQ